MHYVCFRCRLVSRSASNCTRCGTTPVNLGSTFRAPRRTQDHDWVRFEIMAIFGYHCGRDAVERNIYQRRRVDRWRGDCIDHLNEVEAFLVGKKRLSASPTASDRKEFRKLKAELLRRHSKGVLVEGEEEEEEEERDDDDQPTDDVDGQAQLLSLPSRSRKKQRKRRREQRESVEEGGGEEESSSESESGEEEEDDVSSRGSSSGGSSRRGRLKRKRVKRRRQGLRKECGDVL